LLNPIEGVQYAIRHFDRHGLKKVAHVWIGPELILKAIMAAQIAIVCRHDHVVPISFEIFYVLPFDKFLELADLLFMAEPS